MHYIYYSLFTSSLFTHAGPLILEVDFLGVSAKTLNRSFPQKEAQHSFWNIHIPSRCCLASLSPPELLQWRRRADPENRKVRKSVLNGSILKLGKTLQQSIWRAEKEKLDRQNCLWTQAEITELLFLRWATSTSQVSFFVGWMMHLPCFEHRNCFVILGNMAGNTCFWGMQGPQIPEVVHGG